MKTKKFLSLLLCILMLLAAIPFSASAAVTVISSINAMIPIPTVGTVPTDTGVFVNSKAIGIEFDIDWCYEDGTILKADEKYQYGVTYLCVLDITTLENYMFSNDYQMSFAVNGKVISREMVDYRSYTKIYINYEFTPNPIKIGDFDVTIPVPVVGDHPTSLGLVVGADNVNYDVEWLDKNKNEMNVAKAYEPDTDYFCCITIEAKDGCVFKTDMKVKVNGADFNYASKSDTQIMIMYKFRPEPIIVKLLRPVIKLPELGAVATTAQVTDDSEGVYIHNTLMYYADDTEVKTETIKADTDYKLGILYYPDKGYAFTGSASDTKVFADGAGKAEIRLTTASLVLMMYHFRYNSITVSNGSASASAALPGTVVTITAPQVEGKTFRSWTVKGATVNNANAQETTITVGEEAVIAEAVYDDCSCNCHGNFIQKLIFVITNFFAKIFNPAKRVCECGAGH